MKTYLKTEFLGYTIQEEDQRNPYASGSEFKFWPTHQGEQDDCDCDDGETFTYCGNGRWADTLEEAQETISELNPQTNDWKTEEDWAKEEQQMNDWDAAS
jgi:hypothetical protein